MPRSRVNSIIIVCFVCPFVPVLCRAQATAYTITTVAGSATSGFSGDGGSPTSAKLNTPIEVALDSNHNLYISDSANQRIRKVAGGKITTFAGNGTTGYSGDGGAATGAEFDDPYGVAVDSSGNVFISDLSNGVVRKVTTDNKINTIAGTNSYIGYNGDGTAATSAGLYRPLGVVTDASGNVYIADSFDHRIRKVSTDSTITTIAGTGTAGFSGDGGPATSADINVPLGLTIDSAGNLYFADSVNHRIRKVAIDGTISTVAGIGTAGFSGDGGAAIKAQLNRPWDVKVDASGDLFIADYNNNRIRMVTPDGNITTIAGRTGSGYSGDGGQGTSALLSFPTGLAVDTNGDVYIADSDNNVIRLLSPLAPFINPGAVSSLGAYGGSPAIAPGTWVEIHGTNLALDTRLWAAKDFQGANAPTTLDGTTVTVGGQSAFVEYISGSQINIQVPSNVPTGSQTLVVKNPAGTSASYSVTVNAAQPGLLAPPVFDIGGTQYAVALFNDFTTYVLPAGAIPGVTSRAAKPGDTIYLYGIGFGAVTPNIPAGEIVQQPNSLVVAPQFFFNQTPAISTSAGLAGGYVGLYLFSVVVPNVASGNVPLTFTLGGANSSQTLYIPVQQ